MVLFRHPWLDRGYITKLNVSDVQTSNPPRFLLLHARAQKMVARDHLIVFDGFRTTYFRHPGNGYCAIYLRAVLNLVLHTSLFSYL